MVWTVDRVFRHPPQNRRRAGPSVASKHSIFFPNAVRRPLAQVASQSTVCWVSLLGFAHQGREPSWFPIIPYPLRLESRGPEALFLPVLPLAHVQKPRWLKPRRDFCHLDCVARDVVARPARPSRQGCRIGVVCRHSVIACGAELIGPPPKLAKRTKFLKWPVECACQL